jgi:hypothetical protein
MANNYSLATVTPNLPANLFTAEELRSLHVACGITTERIGEDLYFFAEDCFCEQGEDEDGFGVDCQALFQEKLRQLDPPTYPHISIQGAISCSKMRRDEFGGFAVFITRDEIRYMSTWQWLHEQTRRTDVLPGQEATGISTVIPPPGHPHSRFDIEHNPEENPDRVYVLVDGKFDVAIIRTDEGVVVDVYPKDGFETIASTYAFDSDCEQSEDAATTPSETREPSHQ